ncbi:metal ABC transporter permease, partial [Escherichia coli]
MDLSVIDWSEVGDATVETLAMTGGSLFFTVLLGLPLGILLFLTNRGQLLEQRGLYWVLSLVVNVLRSVPFLILLILLIPFTLWL